ncbi:hypothetical protein MPSEU_000597000 [Mayamaea pseudoterrestris]|nr:hypothetical protein MPSEU_000597000 [Mayamaea pseudoterrestris]
MTCSSSVPPPQQTLLCIGQDLFSIDNYVREQYNYSLHHSDNHFHRHANKHHQTHAALSDYVPNVVMSYTDIQTLTGLESPADYGSGIEYANMLDDPNGLWRSLRMRQDDEDVPPPALQLGLWLNGSRGCRDVISGKLQHNVHRLFRFLASRSFHTYLRIGYEFDNPSFGYVNDPQAFQRAFRTMVNYCRSRVTHCRTKVSFVWHSWAASDVNLEQFYPGDDYVDWIGVSLFLQLRRDVTSSITNSSAAAVGNSINTVVRRVLDFAKRRNKPIMIAESTPFGGLSNMFDPWNEWFAPLLNVIDDYSVGMFCYIHCDWDAQPMWHNVGFGDTRLATNDTVMRLWRKRVLSNPRFVRQSKIVSCDERADVEEEASMLGTSFGDTLSLSRCRPNNSTIRTFASGGMLLFGAMLLTVIRRRMKRRAIASESESVRLEQENGSGDNLEHERQHLGYGSIVVP